MVSVAWSHPVEDLMSLRDKVVQVDYMILSHWKYREAFASNGAILYLDAKKRTVMGIWLADEAQLILPNTGMTRYDLGACQIYLSLFRNHYGGNDVSVHFTCEVTMQPHKVEWPHLIFETFSLSLQACW